ncbi:hypothetical protein Bca52824_082687 [Brassica carinata]|uniref:DUF4283 domain-containing protein n=1 Tax=Brassica carinata TaxID=52824 RepID=A0A8X7PIL8_BRACI|nr:hypothetical protein Bca52824_082687 [Brassica carinata]
MLAKNKKPRPPLALSFKAFCLARPARKHGGMANKKNKSISLADLGVVATGSSNPMTNSSPIDLSATSGSALPYSFGVSSSALPLKEVPLSTSLLAIHPLFEVLNLLGGSRSAPQGSKASEDAITPERNYAALLKSSAQLQEMRNPTEHVSGVPFVLIQDENIEAAKLEFKDFVYARFHGDYPSMGKIIGVVNAVWARSGPRIFVHNIGHGIYLLRVNNPRTREVLLSRTCWNIGGLPMFVAPWSLDYSPDEPPLTSAIVLESLSRIATAVGKPDSLAPETERKENFEVTKLYDRVDLTAPLPHKIVSGFSNGKEVQIDVSYPWLPVKCDACKRFGHKTDKCTFGISEGSNGQESARKTVPESSRNISKSRPDHSRDKLGKKVVSRYVPVVHAASGEENGVPAVVQPTNSVPEGETDAITMPLHSGDVVELEEGEIGQEELGETTVCAAASERASASLIEKSASAAEPDLPTGKEAINEEIVSTSSDSADSVTVDGSLSSQTVNDSAVLTKMDVEDTTQTLSVPGTEQGESFDPEEDRDNPFFLVRNRKNGPIPRDWKYYGNYEHNDTGRIVNVWDPKVTMFIYNETAQSVTCGVTILSENITLTVTFVYGFNLVEVRRCLWANLVDLHASTPVSDNPWSVLGDFNQMLRMEEANLRLQDAQLFEAQAKGLPFTWRNCQDDNPISTKIDHAFISQAWSSSFPDFFADYLDPSQSDHAPCLFRMPAIRRQVIKPFKFFHYVIDHPEYAETVTEACTTRKHIIYEGNIRCKFVVNGCWNCSQITGTDQFKLIRSLKLLKRPLRSLNKQHFSGISQRVMAQKERVDGLQRRLLTLPDASTAREAEEKYYKQRSRVRWENLGDRNTPFYHRMVYHHASKNHIHFLKDGILCSTDLSFSSATADELRNLLPFHCSELQQNYLKREVTAAEIKATLYLGLPLSPKRISAATLQPFLDRITAKLHSWTVKFLSFAGKVQMITSVIYGMNSTSSAAGARVSWSDICKPKTEGGLGIRKLEDFEMVFRLKRIWLFFSASGFWGRSIWRINDSPRFSKTVRSMLDLRQELQLYLRCSVRDGNTALFWYDYWRELGPLHLLFGSSGPASLWIPLNATVFQAVRDGHWNLPPARSENDVTLQVILSTMAVPFLASPPTSVAAVVDLCRQLQGPHASRAVAVLKLLNQVIIYNLWRERNAFFKVVDRCTRDRLLSLPSVTAASPSLPEL